MHPVVSMTNDVVIKLFGLPTMIVFIYQDPISLYSNLKFLEPVSWLALVVVAGIEILRIWTAFYNRSKIVCKNDDRITEAMLKIIREPGHTCILSRNLSWTKDPLVREALNDKARHKDLTVFSAEETEVTKNLEKLGASVKIYENFVPKCRFTINNYKSSAAKLFIAEKDENQKHVIYCYASKNNLTLRLSEDFITLLEATAK